MDTNYGARPGLSDAAGKFSGSDLMTIGKRIADANERARKAEAELDAERERHAAEKLAHARTLVALEAALPAVSWAISDVMDDADQYAQWAALKERMHAAIAQARGSRGAP